MATATTAAQETITYQQYKDKRQEEFNKLPIFFAFGNDQFRKACEQRGFEPEDAADHLYAFGAGGYYLKKDAEIVHAWIAQADPLDNLMRNPAFAEDAFYYEMGNHEYHINTYQGNYDVLSCFGHIEYDDCDDYNVYFDQLNFSPEIREAYKKARRRFLKAAAENDWY